MKTGIQSGLMEHRSTGLSTSVLLLLLGCTAALAQTTGLLTLPDMYRTSLSDMMIDDNPWRSEKEEDNPWREGSQAATTKPGFNTRFFPAYDYETEDDPTSRSLFQNEYELERPRTNIFKYSF
ncbi:MAG TPA: hypothetical protein ENJ87_01640 [Gammaproteobacteria bacterium]|nr:hypothetical protein [Gammaproteobacteria bacterium]